MLDSGNSETIFSHLTTQDFSTNKADQIGMTMWISSGLISDTIRESRFVNPAQQ